MLDDKIKLASNHEGEKKNSKILCKLIFSISNITRFSFRLWTARSPTFRKFLALNLMLELTKLIFGCVFLHSRAELELPNVNGAVPGTLRAEGAESERESLLVRPESMALLSSPPTQPKNPNGNNNYEMREYHRSHDNI